MLREIDPEIAAVIQHEMERQREGLELIASENFTSRAVLEALGSVMTNKYAEGYPGKRYYGGCRYMDQAETLAIDRVKGLFGAEHANVQPHSGTQANMAVLFSCLKPGDALLAMDLKHGGHLSHGSPVNFSGILYDVHSYGVHEKTEQIDFDQVRLQAAKVRPKLIVVGASSYPRVIPFEPFREIANEVGAKLMADVAHYAGLIVAGLFPNPVPFCEYVTFTTHKTLRGPRGGVVLTRQPYAQSIDKAVFPGIQGGPLMNVVAAKAVAFQEASTEEFRAYQRRVVENARAMSRAFEVAGIRLVSGGTDTHMLLLDVRSVGLTGKQAESLLEQVGITTNKNVIPFDPLPPGVTSGIRIGTPAITTRGFTEQESEEVARLIADVFKQRGDESVKLRVQHRVLELCEAFPLYA